MRGGGTQAYHAPDLELIDIEIESGFVASTTDQAFYDDQDGIAKEDYVWGGTLDGEFE